MKTQIFLTLLGLFIGTVLGPLIAFASSAQDSMDLMSALSHYRMVDLSYTYTEGMPTIVIPPQFNQSMPYKSVLISKYDETGSLGPFWYWNWFWMGEHTGTHIDAPNHWISGKKFESVDHIPIERLLVPAVVIEVKSKVAANNDYLVTTDDVKAWEQAHGRIPKGAIVVMNSGWGSRWPDQKKFMGLDASGKPHAPGFTPEVAKFLMEEREVNGLATDTVSTDSLGIAGSTNPPFGVHIAVHAKDGYQIEMLANADALTPTGSYLLIAPLRLGGGSGSPARIFGFVPKQ